MVAFRHILKADKLGDGSVVVQHQPSLICNWMDPSQFDWWLSLSQCKDRCQHFNSFDKFVDIQAALQRHVPTNLSLLKTVGLQSFLSLKTDCYSFSSDSKRLEILWGSECSNFPGISVELQDMVNDVDIDGDESVFMLLVSGSCGTWSSSCLAAGRIPRRPHLSI